MLLSKYKIFLFFCCFAHGMLLPHQLYFIIFLCPWCPVVTFSQDFFRKDIGKPQEIKHGFILGFSPSKQECNLSDITYIKLGCTNIVPLFWFPLKLTDTKISVPFWTHKKCFTKNVTST